MFESAFNCDKILSKRAQNKGILRQRLILMPNKSTTNKSSPYDPQNRTELTRRKTKDDENVRSTY